MQPLNWGTANVKLADSDYSMRAPVDWLTHCVSVCGAVPLHSLDHTYTPVQLVSASCSAQVLRKWDRLSVTSWKMCQSNSFYSYSSTGTCQCNKGPLTFFLKTSAMLSCCIFQELFVPFTKEHCLSCTTGFEELSTSMALQEIFVVRFDHFFWRHLYRKSCIC